MNETCKAAWSGGKCKRGPDAARGLCQGHYAQWRRQGGGESVAYEPLREAGGGAGTVPVTVHLPLEVAAEYKRAAKESGKGVSELLRPWLEDGFKRHLEVAAGPTERKLRQAARKRPPPVG